MQHIEETEIIKLAKSEWTANLSCYDASLKIENILLREVELCKEDRPAVLFSGGLDSSLVAAALSRAGKSPVLYVFSEGEAEDLVASRKFADYMGFEIKVACVDDLSHPFQINYFLRSHEINSVHHLAMSILGEAIDNLAVANGVKIMWNGSGADLVFAGDQSPDNYGEVNDFDAWKEVFKQKQLAIWHWRFCYISKNQKKQPLAISPFASLDMMRVVSQTDPRELFSDGLDKMPLRILADRWGLPSENTWRPKEMAQRGSGLFSYLEGEMMKQVDDLTNLRVSHNRRDYREGGNFLALRIWVAWMAEREGVQTSLHNKQPPLPLQWSELRKELGL